MSDLSIIPLEDGFETQLAQDWNGATGTVYVLDTPSYTPTTTNTYIVVNPGKTTMQIAEITDYDSTANTLTVSNVTLLKGLGINSTAPASSHATGSKVIISDNYQFWVDIQTAINSKLDDTGGTMTGLLQFSGTTHAGIKLLSLTTVQRDAISASNGMIIYNSTTGELNQYIGGAWSAVAAGSTQPTASTTVLGKIKTDVTPAGDPVALITDNPKYDALAGTSGTPSTSNKYVTNDDTALTGNSKVLRLTSGGKVTTSTIDTGVTDGKIIMATTGNKLPVIDGSNLTNLTPATTTNKTQMVASTTVINNSHGNVSTASASYVEVAAWTVPLYGQIRLGYTLVWAGGAGDAYARVYVNGIAVGTERTTSTSAAFADDFTINYGDRVSIYAKAVGTSPSTQVNSIEIRGSIIPFTITTVV